jgi:NAD-dependent deacetylase sirtuin 2
MKDEHALAIQAYVAKAASAKKPVSNASWSLSTEETGSIRLTVRCFEHLLIQLEKAPDGRIVIPELEDFELVNRSREGELGSLAMFFDRTLRNLDTARQARGFDFSALGTEGINQRDQAIREQQRELRYLRQLHREFDIILEDPSGLSKITSASGAAIEAATIAANQVFPECDEKSERLLGSLDLRGVAAFIQAQRPKIIVMMGAGASTSAGIPDFRSPGTGLYDNLQKYNLPYPTAVFDLKYFREHPEAFFLLVNELWPGSHEPTPVHRFIRALHDEGLLLRCYTQNIDGLEILAGIPEELLVEAHGHFRTAHGVETGKEVPIDAIKDAVRSGGGAAAVRAAVGELAKPDVTFFGEALPRRFDELSREDFPRCELLIVIGTSLQVVPFNLLIADVPLACPRLLVNRDRVGLEARTERDIRRGHLRGGFRIAEDSSTNSRDVFVGGPCDEAVRAIAAELGWSGRLDL